MRQYTSREKADWLAAWKASGQTAVAFSKDKPFSVSSLRYWDRTTTPERAAEFIAIRTESMTAQPKLRLTYPSGIILEIFDTIDSETVKALLQ